MNALRHVLANPFIAATGFAALIHSTWSLGTMFAGEQPTGWHVLGWLIPALLIAFALDIGQIVTSHDIREYGLTRARGITFVVFAAATYYLQWLYIAHHMPAMALSPGISAIAQSSALSLRDAALWIIPALLPLSTLLYTLSSDTTRRETTPAAIEVIKPQENSIIPIIEVNENPPTLAPFGNPLLEVGAPGNIRTMQLASVRIASDNGNGARHDV